MPLVLSVGASSSGSLLNHCQKDVVKEELQRGAASCHTSHVGVAMELWSGGRPLCAHHNSQLMVRWMMSSGPRWRMGDRGPQGHINTLDPDMSLSYKSRILSSCCQLGLTRSQQPAGLTHQGWGPKGGLATSTQVFCPFMEPNQFPSHWVNDLGSTGKEMAPNLPFGQGAWISRGNLLSQWPHVGHGELIGNKISSSLEKLNFAFLSQLELLPLPSTSPSPGTFSHSYLCSCTDCIFHVYYHPAQCSAIWHMHTLGEENHIFSKWSIQGLGFILSCFSYSSSFCLKLCGKDSQAIFPHEKWSKLPVMRLKIIGERRCQEKTRTPFCWNTGSSFPPSVSFHLLLR